MKTIKKCLIRANMPRQLYRKAINKMICRMLKYDLKMLMSKMLTGFKHSMMNQSKSITNGYRKKNKSNKMMEFQR